MRSKRERRTRPRGTAEVTYALNFWARGWVILLGLAPVLVAMAVGAVQGTAVDGAFFPAPDYPAFTTLSAGMLIPAVVLLAAALISLPLPLEDSRGSRRVDMAWLAVLSIGVTLVSLVLDEGRPDSLDWAPYAAAGIFAAIVVLLTVRGVLSATKVLPKSWRGTYRSTDSV